MEKVTQHDPGVSQGNDGVVPTQQLELATPQTVDRLNQTVGEILEIDPKQAQSLSETALQIAKQIGYRCGEATSRTRLAWLAYLRGDIKTTLIEAGIAEQLALIENDAALLCNTLYMMSIPHDVVGNYAEAFELRLRVLELARTHHLQDMEFRSLNIIGWQYERLGKYPQALEAYQRALELSQNTNSQFTPLFRNNLSTIYAKMNEPWQAIELSNQALAECPLENARFQAHIRHTLGQAYTKTGDYEQAFRQYEAALRLFDNPNGELGLELRIEIEVDATYLYLKLNHTNQAKKLAQNALDLATQIESQTMQSLAHHALCRCCEQVGDFATALGHAEQAAELKLAEMRHTREQRLVALQVTHTLREERYIAELKAFQLEKLVQEKTVALETAQLEIVARLAQASVLRHAEDPQHTERVSQIAATLAAALDLPGETVECIRHASRLHDIGSLTLPDRFFIRKKKLRPRQRMQVQAHAEAGAQLLRDSSSRVLQMAEEIARTHHERWDGLGYPDKLAGHAIPISGRITAIAHAFEEYMTASGAAVCTQNALKHIRIGSGTEFDPHLASLLHLIIERKQLTIFAPANASTQPTKS